MECLKLTSIRLSKDLLDKASKLGKELGYYKTSDVLRVAIWLGLKILKPGVLHKYLDMMWKEELGWSYFSLDDVLHTTGGLQNDEHSAKS